MFDRFVSLILITAVIACPLSCGIGGCHVDQRCADRPKGLNAQMLDKQAQPFCAQPFCAQPFCAQLAALEPCGRCVLSPEEQTSEEMQEQHNDREPCPCSEDSVCQGICGGAVVEKPCDLNLTDINVFLPSFSDEKSIGGVLAQSRTGRYEYRHDAGDKNYGRVVRTRHSSFLC